MVLRRTAHWTADVLVRATALVLTLVAVACGSGPTAPTTLTPTLTLAVAYRSDLVIVAGSTLQLSAVVTMSDGTQANVTAEASWQSSATTIAKVSPTGLVTAADGGTVTISATYQGLSASIAQVVAPRPLTIAAPCLSLKAGTNGFPACFVVVTAGTNPASTGVHVYADLRAFGLGAMVELSSCHCGGYDMDLHIPPSMAPGVVPIPISAIDSQGRTATGTAYLTILPG